MQPASAWSDLNGGRAAREALELTAAMFPLMHWHRACRIGILFVDKAGTVTYSKISAYTAHQRLWTMMMQLSVTPPHSVVLH